MTKKKRPRPSKRRAATIAQKATRHRTRSAAVAADVATLPITIVGVGASAGGLEAFSQLLEAIPHDSGIAVIFVQHLSPNQESALPALLASHTRMPVEQVTNGVAIQPNRVYVIPPNVQMMVDHGTLELRPRPHDRSPYTPIDTFFTSLSEMPEGQVIGVVLSGTASDGALGIRDIKAAGGITFAQQPESAKYDGMPRAAIASGAIDLVMTPAKIGAQIANIASHPYVRRARVAHEGVTREPYLDEIFDLLRPVSGVDFRHYKLPTIRRRLLRRMALHRITEVDTYLKLLHANPDEVRGLSQDLLIHVTRFFREPESFDALAEDVLPSLIEDRSPEQPLRMWVCGCATGEEAYSLAITVVEFLQRKQSDIRVQIFATDVSDTAIERARAGVYPASIAADVGPVRLRRFFTKSEGNYRVNKLIRSMCVFARQDLTKDPPFSRLDLVMCRNVLIYLDTTLQKKLIGLFHYALNPSGFLVLGAAETVGSQASLFSLVEKKYRIHRKKTTARGLPATGYPLQPPHPLAAPKRVQPGASPTDNTLQLELSRIILDRYAPPGVVVDADLQIVHVRGQTGAFLEPAPGDASLDLLKMVREGLLYGVRSAVSTARKTKAPVRKDGLQVKAGQIWKPVAIEVVPLTAFGRPHFLIVFEEPGPGDAARGKAGSTKPAKRTKSIKTRDDQEVAVLQRELAASREYMQSIIQELEAANEELQSANEEILSSNEELQSTNEELDTAKEELQSTNEELNTVNEELHGRNEEMSRINSDLMNLVGSVQIAIVIVSSDMRIRRFTPMAEKVLNLIPTDLDRSITHINPNIDCPNLEQLIHECIDSVSPVERDVRDRQGRWYSLRIRPYKSLDNRIDGAVLALFDIDILKTSERRAMVASEFADAILHFTNQPFAVTDAKLQIRQVNSAFASLFSTTAGELVGRPLEDLARGDGFAAWRDGAKPGAVLPPIVTTSDRRRTTFTIAGRVVPAIDGRDSHVVLVTVQDTARGQ